MIENGRQRAKIWPYNKYSDYVKPLREDGAKWFEEKGYEVQNKYPYILNDANYWRNNIILPEVANYIDEEIRNCNNAGKGFPLHKYIHHGLSSQAMLFNLIVPLILNNDINILKPVFENKGIPFPEEISGATLELEDRKVFSETRGQPTSIDLVIKNITDRQSLYIEFKYSETAFGGCSVFGKGDCEGRNPANDPSLCYLNFLGRKYWDLLKEQGFLQGQFIDSPICMLANYYQFFREVAFAIHNGGYFVLLHDERNPAFINDSPAGLRGLWPFLMAFVPDHQKGKVKEITIQEVFRAICETNKHSHWTNEFANKYNLKAI